MKRWYLLAGCFIVFAAPALYGARAPEWTNGHSKKHPAETYLVGVGVGKSLDGARSAARAEIAKIFKSRIVQSAQEINREQSASGGGGRSETSSLEAELKTNVSTDELLEGTEIAETWCDKKKKTCYALALLNKPKLRAVLSQQASDLESGIQAQLSTANRAESLVEKIRALSQALRLMDRKDELLAKKRVVDPVAVPDLPSGMGRAGIIKQKEETASRIRFVIDTPDDALKSALSSTVTGMGFNVLAAVPSAQDAGTAVIVVKPSVAVTPFERGNPQWRFYNWNASAEVTEIAAGTGSFSSIARQGQSSHLQEEGARNKAATDAVQALSLELEQQIGRHFYGDRQ